MDLLRLTVDHADGVSVLALAGELDISGTEALEAELSRLESDGATKPIVLDLSALEFLDSTGLRVLVFADARARDAGRRFALIPGGEAVQRVFEITHLDDRLTFVAAPAELADGSTAA